MSDRSKDDAMKEYSYLCNKEDAPDVDDMVILQHVHWIVTAINPVSDFIANPQSSCEYVRVHVKRAID